MKRFTNLTLVFISLFIFPFTASAEDNMIEMTQLKVLVITPTLQKMEYAFPGATNPAAIDCLSGIAAHESTIGGVTHLKQVNGPALGIFQIEPATHDDLFRNYLYYKAEKSDVIYDLVPRSAQLVGPETRAYAVVDDQLVVNLEYQAAIARTILYRKNFGTWPSRTEMSEEEYIAALAKIWKDQWNTHLGAGTVQQYIDAFPREVL